MSLDPSIYSQVGRVNVGEGISNIINQQRQLENENLDRQNKLAAMAYQQQALQQAQTQKRNQELNMWLSSAVQSGRPLEEVLPEAIAKGKEIGVMPEATQQHVTSVYAAQTPQARSDIAFTQAYPELVAKQRAESMFARPVSQAAPSNVGKLIQEREALPPNDPRRATYDAAIQKEIMISQTQQEKPVNWTTLQTDKGFVQIHPQTGQIRELGVQAPPKPAGKGGPISQEMQDQASISAQQVLDQANKLLNHPGRLAATGASSFMSKIPGTEARGFSANLDTFKAQTFLPMVSALKGMGALSDAEGKKIADSVGALDPSMPEKEFEQSLKDTMDFLYRKAAAAGLNVQNPLQTQTAGSHPADISALLNKYK